MLTTGKYMRWSRRVMIYEMMGMDDDVERELKKMEKKVNRIRVQSKKCITRIEKEFQEIGVYVNTYLRCDCMYDPCICRLGDLQEMRLAVLKRYSINTPYNRNLLHIYIHSLNNIDISLLPKEYVGNNTMYHKIKRIGEEFKRINDPYDNHELLMYEYIKEL